MFLENGKEFKGKFHKMGNGFMTGVTHTAASKMLVTAAPKTKDSMAAKMAKLRAMRR